MCIGNAVLCGRLCLELLRCCNSRLSAIRQESCAILYLLMRSNFEFSNRKGLTRVHLQVKLYLEAKTSINYSRGLISLWLSSSSLAVTIITLGLLGTELIFCFLIFSLQDRDTNIYGFAFLCIKIIH